MKLRKGWVQFPDEFNDLLPERSRISSGGNQRTPAAEAGELIATHPGTTVSRALHVFAPRAKSQELRAYLCLVLNLLVLIILDGWGYRAETKANAIALARKPTYDRLLREYPNTLIHTSGPFVGLPEGQMGNSEVGHLNIGAGRIVHMDITRIDLMIQNGEFFSHPVLLDAMKHARTGERRLHLFGLVSDGGVHSQQAHLYALLKMAKQNGLERVFVHAFMDGRDTLPTNGAGYLEQLQQKMREYNCGKIATVNGRYYAMDRDRRWERIAKAYNAMVFADAEGGK